MCNPRQEASDAACLLRGGCIGRVEREVLDCNRLARAPQCRTTGSLSAAPINVPAHMLLDIFDRCKHGPVVI